MSIGTHISCRVLLLGSLILIIFSQSLYNQSDFISTLFQVISIFSKSIDSYQLYFISIQESSLNNLTKTTHGTIDNQVKCHFNHLLVLADFTIISQASLTSKKSFNKLLFSIFSFTSDILRVNNTDTLPDTHSEILSQIPHFHSEISLRLFKSLREFTIFFL